ncbi:DUF6456 domain-containing protein [Falsirhodobacter algicola]|uniref:Helix-turn-helix domain-containing protein n=1 Tax=Falsirhodobacter algicola TaxID=2692330 RepID=A0A8J8SJR3_9RHOB|nr:DUF6456 domain-containing protein [Falsirhodobacter algicola]QUS35080.1 helix-turn-helix domain-containing protein [Falsirhodobacter algicola]
MGPLRPIIPRYPEWLPAAVRLYLDHTVAGVSLRVLARREGVHPSTVLRHVRRIETHRDDPLTDAALSRLGPHCPKEAAMVPFPPSETTLEMEAQRILRRLAEPGTLLAFAPEMEKAVVLRELPGGETARLAVVARELAEAFVLKDWIACRKAGRISTYGLTPQGRHHLRQGAGLAEAPAAFDWNRAEPPRILPVETPVAQMGRRRDKDGQPFLSAELVAAAERLREDFELAQMDAAPAPVWEGFLDMASAPFPATTARGRVAAALRDLGPGLGDVVLRVCCYLEGLEPCEKRMGWAARSGKVVLRIGLERLRRHYAELSRPMIG